MLEAAVTASPQKEKPGIGKLFSAGKYVGNVAGSLSRGLTQVNAYR